VGIHLGKPVVERDGSRAAITKAEKAKNTPPMAPAPIAATMVAALRIPDPGPGRRRGVVAEIAQLAAERTAHAVSEVRVAPSRTSRKRYSTSPATSSRTPSASSAAQHRAAA
jgi:hypothetical protein